MTQSVQAQPVFTGTVDFRGWQTWYRITGDLASTKAPLVALHGGPGVPHDYLLLPAALADGCGERDGRAFIHYDQVGCGRSTHVREKRPDFWRPELFVDELENLLRQIGVDRRYHLLGQS